MFIYVYVYSFDNYNKTTFDYESSKAIHEVADMFWLTDKEREAVTNVKCYQMADDGESTVKEWVIF